MALQDAPPPHHVRQPTYTVRGKVRRKATVMQLETVIQLETVMQLESGLL